MAAADFILDIEQRISGNAVGELEKTQAAFNAAAASLKRFESASMSADKSLAATTAKLEGVRGKMAAAMEAGDGKAFWKAAAEAQKLEAAQAKLAEKSAAAKVAFDAQAQAVESVGTQLAGLTAEQRAAAESAQLAANEAKALAEQQANLERHTKAATAAAEAQQRELAKVAAAEAAEEAKALAQQQQNLEKHTQAASRAAAEQARVMQQQQSKAIADIDAKTQRMNQTAMAAAVALAAVALVAAKAAWAAAKWVGAFVFAKKAKELEELSTRLKKNFSDMFGGLNLDPLMAGLSRLVDFFSVSTESGKALKALFEGLFQPLADGAPGILSKIERLMLGMVIGALKVGIAVKQAAAAFDFDLGVFESWPEVGKIGEFAAYAIAGAFVALGVAVAAAVAPFYLIVEGLMAVDAATKAGIKAMEDFVLKVGIVWSRLDFGQIATFLIDGFVNGIKAGIARAVAAVKEMANAARNAAADVLDLGSPSRLFAQFGEWTAEGFAGGVEDGTPDAVSAVRSLVAPPDAPALPAARGAGATVTFAAGSIVIQASDGTDAGDLFVARVTELLEGLGMQVGAPA